MSFREKQSHRRRAIIRTLAAYHFATMVVRDEAKKHDQESNDVLRASQEALNGYQIVFEMDKGNSMQVFWVEAKR